MYFPHSDSYQQYSLCEFESDLRSYEHYLTSREKKAWKKFGLVFFSGLLSTDRLSSVHNCEDRFHIHVFIRSSNIWLSYIHSRLILPILGQPCLFLDYHCPFCASFSCCVLYFKLKVDLQPTKKYSFERNRCIFTIIVRNTIVITLAIVNLLGLVLILDTFLISVTWVFSFTLLLFWDTTEKNLFRKREG